MKSQAQFSKKGNNTKFSKEPREKRMKIVGKTAHHIKHRNQMYNFDMD